MSMKVINDIPEEVLFHNFLGVFCLRTPHSLLISIFILFNSFQLIFCKGWPCLHFLFLAFSLTDY